MRMLLTSGGVHGGPVQDALQDLVGKPFSEARTVVVVDAFLPFPGDKGHFLQRMQDYRALGWAETDLLTLNAAPHAIIEERLRSADVVYCYGGTNHWLAHSWRVNGFVPVLREILEEQVYLGISAGSMIFSTQHAAAVEALDDQEEVGWLQLDEVGPALPLFDWYLLPHLGAEYFPTQTDDWAARTAPRFAGDTWFLDDESALLIRDPAAPPEVVSGGHWLHYGPDGALVASA
jgi:dipeptidase E